MVQRITITIPDGLYERLQAVKDRINVSGICQEAIMQAVGIEEVKAQDLPEMEKLLAKLQAEKKQHEVILSTQWRDRGFKEGLEDAHHIHYRDFIHLERSLAFHAGRDLHPVVTAGDNPLKPKATPTAISVTKGFNAFAKRLEALKFETRA